MHQMLIFFGLPSILTIDKRSEELSRVKWSKWLSKINQKNLNPWQTPEKKSTLLVCGIHFVNETPSALCEITDPTWIATINLGYELVTISSAESVAAGTDRKRDVATISKWYMRALRKRKKWKRIYLKKKFNTLKLMLIR